MKSRKESAQKVVPISPWLRTPAPSSEAGAETELPADLATVQRWLNYAEIALNTPAKRRQNDKSQAA